MPTYDYECRGCGAKLEIFQSITESARRKCPECGALKLNRRIGTGAGILFKGSGFYQTDYRSDSYKKSAEADKSPDKSPDKSSGKPEKKSSTDSKKKPDKGSD